MASAHWLTQINCYDNMITGENWAVSHIIRSLWDKARGRWRSKKKFPSKRRGTIAKGCHCRAWQLHRWAKCVLSHPPLCSRVITPHTTRCPWARAYHTFCSAAWEHNAGWRNRTGTKPAIIELCLWDLEPAGSCSSIFILMAKQRGPICLWLEKIGKWVCFFYSVLLLWNTCLWGKRFYFFLSLGTTLFKKKKLNTYVVAAISTSYFFVFLCRV